MAFASFRGRRVYVFTYTKKGGQKALLRSQTRHLDGESEEVVNEWVTRWSNLNEVKKVRPDLVTAALPNSWLSLIAEFTTHLTTLGRSDNTITDHVRHIRQAMPFFITCEQLSDFPKISRKLGEWLKARDKTPRRIWAINQSLQIFWKYLDVNRGLVEGELRLVGGVKASQKTPLKLLFTKNEILAFGIFIDPKIRLLALIGYFFSLRPQEVLALTPEHFLAGSAASDKECCKVLHDSKLYNKLAVNIVRQKVGKDFKLPKKNSVGWVGCFDETAAKAIVRALAGIPKTELIFKFRTDTYYKKWKKLGLPNSVIKDMRRASLYHLGHYSDLPLVALKNHARHKAIETTMLYTRRPEELSDSEWKVLDLDA